MTLGYEHSDHRPQGLEMKHVRCEAVDQARAIIYEYAERSDARANLADKPSTLRDLTITLACILPVVVGGAGLIRSAFGF